MGKERGGTAARGPGFRRMFGKLAHKAANGYNVITFISVVILGYLVIVPLAQMVLATVQWSKSDLRLSPEASPGAFTLFHWIRTFASEISASTLYKPLVNSLIIGFSVSAVSIALGCALAYVFTRTDFPFKKLLSFLVMIPYILPSWYLSTTWLTIFKNDRIGGAPGFIQSLFGVNPPNWLAYGLFPIIITMSIHYYAYTFLLVSSALSSIGGDLEEMARIKGASRFTVLRRITLPLIRPALMSSFILTFSRAIGTFGIPAMLGLKVRFYTVSTMLYSSIRSRQAVSGYILSIVLIVLAVGTIIVNQVMLGKRRSYTTISGKATRKNLAALGKWKVPANILIWLFVALVVIVPILILITSTFMLKDGVYSLSNFTTHYWTGASTPEIASGEAGVLRNASLLTGLQNTLVLVVSSSMLATVIGILFGYIISRGRGRLSGRLVEQVSFLPYLIPSIALGAIYLSMFAAPRGVIPALYGTMTLLIVISVVKYLPFSTRAGTSTMMQISTELEEAAQVKGAGLIRRFTRILLPLSKKGFMSGFLLIFISAMKELDLLVLLTTPSTATLTALTYSYSDLGFDQLSNVVILIIMALTMAIYLLSEKLAKADISQGIGG